MLKRIKALGPGLLYAGAAIGVSHLVQSTKAGAFYGYLFIVAIMLAHLFKYPYFALGPRYANRTGTSLVDGYAKLGKGIILTLGILTFLTMFFIQAAVTIVTAGLAQQLTQIDLPTWQWSLILLAVCLAILRIGKFAILDKLMKVIIVVLSLSTVLACALSFRNGIPEVNSWIDSFHLSNDQDVNFLVAFVGWMPAPLDIAIVHSIWSVSSYAMKKHKTSAEEEFDFRTGFFGTALLGIFFLVLGANIWNNSGAIVEVKADLFAHQLITMFTESLGSGFHYVILVAAFATMFSTTLTVLDALPRILTGIRPHIDVPMPNLGWWHTILAVGAGAILTFWVNNMAQMVSFATSLSFLATPLLAYFSLRLVRNEPDLQLWSRSESNIAKIGLAIMALLSVLFVVIKLNELNI